MTVFFFGAFLFGIGINLEIYCKSKSFSTCENWHFNRLFFIPPSNSTPFHAQEKAKNALLTTTL
jgi:hypothetical protein